jgi:hypothetical protein
MAEKEEFLALARKRFAAAAEDEKHLREKFIEDLRFASPDGDDQWDPKVKSDRLAAGRPAMSFPRCHTFVQQVSNEARQNKPQIKFSPRLDADKETADVYEGLARYIQYTSDAQIAYETAIEYSAGASFGYYRFLTEYAAEVDDMPDDTAEENLPKDLKVVPVLDPLTIYGVLVPACFNRKCFHAFVIEDMPKDEFERQYPDSEASSLGWSEAEKKSDGWIGSDSVRIAEYWYVEEGKKDKGLRKPKSKVKFCKTNGLEILPDSETEWAGSTIPIIPVLGKQMIMEGKPRLFSVVRPQKSAQQLINYSKSRIAETLSTSPITPFMVAEGQIEGYEKQWETLNTTLRPYLTYKVVDSSGRPIQPPQRQTFEPPIQSLSAFVAQEVDDMKATTGIFDASLGASSNEVSGQAILRRKQQTDITTMHFIDNLTRALKKGGAVIAEMIPKIYDTDREIEILGEDESTEIVRINAEYVDEATGKKKNYDMTKGKFVPIVTVGQAFDSKRMESFDTMQQLVQSAPTMLPMFGDILFKNSDMAGADQLSERFHKMLPPNLQSGDDQEKVPPQAQAQLKQLGEHNQALNAACGEYEKQIQQLTAEKQGKVVEHQGKMQEIAAKAVADMELEEKKLFTAVTVAEINTKAQNAADREADRRALEAQFHDQAHDVAMQAQGAEQQRQASVQQAQQQQEAQSQQADAQSQQSAQDAQQQQEAQPAEGAE